MNEGTVVGDYTITQKLGAGRVTAVYAAVHNVLESEHALRVLLPQWAESAERRAAFLAHGNHQTGFEHRGLLRVTDAVDAAVPALVTDRLVGQSLRQRLNAEGWIAPKEAVQIASRVLEALVAAGIPHGRLSPESIFIEDDGTVKVLGFGQVLPGVDPPVTVSVGTVRAYLAPELIDGEEPAFCSDVFSMGALLWEMVAGRSPFEGNSAFLAMKHSRSKNPGSPDRHGEVPGWLEGAIEAALAKRARDRLQSAGALLKVLAAGPRGADLPAIVPAVKASGGSRGFLTTVLVLFVGALLVGSVAVGSLVLLLWFNRPANIHSVGITSDSCGLLTVNVDAYSNEPLEYWVGGKLLHTEITSGRQSYVHSFQVDPGQLANVDVLTGGATHSQSHGVAGTPTGLRFEVQGETRQGMLGNTRVHVEGSCVPDGLTYVANVDGKRVEGAANSPIELHTRGLNQGRHLVSVDLMEGDQILISSTTKILVGEAPPANDLDLDGYLTGEDCNDSDPTVNPGRPELLTPNGVDDNCDGRVDEGTTAYDDDGDGLSEQDGDCDDADPSVRPGIPELPDCRDQNCDGQIDEGVVLRQIDDGYEPNDTLAQAFDLKTSSLRHFSKDLELVASSSTDEAWFRFFSQDGDFDDWGIDVTVPGLPANSSVLLEVYDSGGGARGSLLVTDPSDMLAVRGRAFRDDSGDYRLLVRPKALHAAWCPIKVHIEAR